MSLIKNIIPIIIIINSIGPNILYLNDVIISSLSNALKLLVKPQPGQLILNNFLNIQSSLIVPLMTININKITNNNIRIFLNLFINNVVQSEDFKASEILIAFLSYTDRGKFESKIKEYQSQIPSAYVEDYKTLEGKVIISHDEGNEKYFTNISKYFRLQSQIFQKLNLSLKNFYIYF